MKKASLLFALLFMGSTFVGCKKYEEGPRLSIRTKKHRVTNTWNITRQFRNGVDSTLFYAFTGSTFILDREGQLQTTVTESRNQTFFTQFSNGTWEFANNKEELIFDVINVATSIRTVSTLKIKRLKEKEMWLTETLDNGVEVEWRLEELQPF